MPSERSARVSHLWLSSYREFMGVSGHQQLTLYAYLLDLPAALVPPELVTVTLTGPAACAGVAKLAVPR